MSEVRRHIPTVCYVETAPWLFSQVDRPNIVPMPIVSAEYNPATDAPNRWWPSQVETLLAEWTRQGWHDRLAFRFRLFNQAGWPPNTQVNFSNFLAAVLPYIIAPHGFKKIDFIFSGNEDTAPDGSPLYTAQQLRAAYGNLAKVATTFGNWNNAEGGSWWGSFVNRTAARITGGAVKSAIPQCYECTDLPSLARISEAISHGPKDTVPWLPCHSKQDERGRWVMVDERISLDSTRTLILDAVGQGVERFGLFLHPFCEQDRDQPVNAVHYRLTQRAHRYLDLVNRTIDEANSLYGRV